MTKSAIDASSLLYSHLARTFWVRACNDIDDSHKEASRSWSRQRICLPLTAHKVFRNNARIFSTINHLTTSVEVNLIIASS